MNEAQKSFLQAVSAAIFPGQGIPSVEITDDLILEASQQAVTALILPQNRPEALRITANNIRLVNVQKEVDQALQGIPYAVLKGLAAAIYYPEPLKRSLGDIDIIVAPKDFAKAYHALEKGGFAAEEALETDDRHLHFHKNGICIELHHRFAILNTKEQEEQLDGWIFEALPSLERVSVANCTFPILPQLLNGLVLLSHINQHMESGLGVRQMIDWTLYVDQRLHDADWLAFQEKADLLGLTRLAKVASKWGQMYLGLSQSIFWCQEAEDDVCEKLLEYIIESGNFGGKYGVNDYAIRALSRGRSVGGIFKHLQNLGKRDWTLLQKYPWLSPFAWVYQAGKYMVKLLKARIPLRELLNDVKESENRDELMEAVGVSRRARRIQEQ